MAPTMTLAEEVSVSKLGPSEIEVYQVQVVEDEYTRQREGVVLRQLRPDGMQSFQCITCGTENSYNFSPCTHIKALRGHLGARTVADDHCALVS